MIVAIRTLKGITRIPLKPREHTVSFRVNEALSMESGLTSHAALMKNTS